MHINGTPVGLLESEMKRIVDFCGRLLNRWTPADFVRIRRWYAERYFRCA